MKTVFTTLSVIFGVIFSHSVLAQDVTIYYTNDIHAHVGTPQPIKVNNTLIVSTDAYGTNIGKLVLDYNP
ncbi:hypothetical protein UZ965_25480, partial [Escherichia coli]|nr:hypothetical protein [Escherichia coli]